MITSTATTERTLKPAIVNCCIGLGVGVEKREDGMGHIYVMKDVISPAYDGPALRAFMEEVAVRWLEQVAPHRLNYGADDR